MMPSEGAAARSQQLGTLARLNHERATRRGSANGWRSSRASRWRSSSATSCASRGATGSAPGASPRSSRPSSRARAPRASRRGRRRGRPTTSQMFAPALARNVRARPRVRRAASPARARPPTRGCSATTTSGCAPSELTRLFDGARRGAAAARRRRPNAALRRARSRCPWPPSARPSPARSRGSASTSRAGASTSRRTRSRPGSASGDTRVTTRYNDGNVESLLSSLHEYGHALYERQIDPALRRTNLGRGTSMSVHESQSKLWENHVARSAAFAELLAGELGGAGFEISAARAARDARRRQALARARVRRRAHLPAAHHPALRARAGDDRRRARRRRPARRLARGHRSGCSAWRFPRTRSAACRTCTGAPAASATSPATRSGA